MSFRVARNEGRTVGGLDVLDYLIIHYGGMSFKPAFLLVAGETFFETDRATAEQVAKSVGDAMVVEGISLIGVAHFGLPDWKDRRKRSKEIEAAQAREWASKKEFAALIARMRGGCLPSQDVDSDQLARARALIAAHASLITSQERAITLVNAAKLYDAAEAIRFGADWKPKEQTP